MEGRQVTRTGDREARLGSIPSFHSANKPRQGSINHGEANHFGVPPVYNGYMLCAPSPCRQTGKCTHEWRCTNLKTGHAISKPGRSCRSALALACSSGKTRHQSVCATTNFAVRYQGKQQYSIIALTDESGNVTVRYAYDAYGVPTVFNAAGVELPGGSAENNRYMYTGRERIPTLASSTTVRGWTTGVRVGSVCVIRLWRLID